MTCVKSFKGFKRWGPGNNGDPELNIINHHNKHVLNSGFTHHSENYSTHPENYYEDWRQHLDTLDVKSYKNFALEKSKHMINRTVHSNGSRVYLSGTYKNVLIIGRLDEDDQLGISSCYIIHDHLLEKKLKIFELHRCFSF
jgi:hypothetical protein